MDPQSRAGAAQWVQFISASGRRIKPTKNSLPSTSSAAEQEEKSDDKEEEEFHVAVWDSLE